MEGDPSRDDVHAPAGPAVYFDGQSSRKRMVAITLGDQLEIGEGAARTMDHDGQLLRPGDRVAIAEEVNCGECWYCRHQYNNKTCLNQIMAYGLHPNADTPPYPRGGFSEYMYYSGK